MGPQKGRWGTTLQYLGFLCSCLASSSLADLQALSLGCTPGLPRLLLVTTLRFPTWTSPEPLPVPTQAELSWRSASAPAPPVSLTTALCCGFGPLLPFPSEHHILET